MSSSPSGSSAAAQPGKDSSQQLASEQPILRILLQNPSHAVASSGDAPPSGAEGDDTMKIRLGGGAPHCPCVFFTQIDKQLQDKGVESGDELVMIGKQGLISKTADEAEAMLREAGPQVEVTVRKLPQMDEDGKPKKRRDLTFKRLRHKLLDSLGARTFAFLGINHAAVSDDSFSEQIDKFQEMHKFYTGLVKVTTNYIRQFTHVANDQQTLVDALNWQLQRDHDYPSLQDRMKFTTESHSVVSKSALEAVPTLEKICAQMKTFLEKAIPDTKMTHDKYNAARYDYLAYCLKLHEMAEQEQIAQEKGQPLPRVQNGNLVFRTTLRESYRARRFFESLRSDVMDKLRILETKHALDLCDQLFRFTQALGNHYEDSREALMTAEEAIGKVDDSALERCSAAQQDL